MLTSADFTKNEDTILAPYAVHSACSQGREYREEPLLYRTEFQRDRDRVVHSRAFRRLMHKTQVFVAYEGDHYRTRLTHTLEVAQIARHVARMLSLNEDLTEVIALAHDLGHTPFGHAGEATLDGLMREQGGFEHNRQSRRVVELLELKYKDFPGLNLTYETRDGLTKHRSAHDHPANNGLGFASLESRVVNLADEIAYNSHDLDDGLASGLIKIKELDEVALWQEATEYNRKKYPVLNEEELRNLNVRYLIGEQINDLVRRSDQNIQKKELPNVDAVYKCAEPLVEFTEEMQGKNETLRDFLLRKFYQHPRVKQMNDKAREMIEFLFAYYLEHPAEVPFVEKFKQEPLPRVVTDYIAGMTDNFATEEFSRSRGSK
jgi:dGTPase